MRILVTGGAGFIGSNLIERLNRDGRHEVLIFDNETSGSRKAVADLDCEFVNGDIRDADAIRTALAGIEAVVHLAADTQVVRWIERPAENFDVNVAGGLTLLEAMRSTRVERLINASTGGAIIGDAEPPVHEAMIPAPLSPYGAAKLAFEGYCSAYGASYGIRSCSLRFSNVYGPRSWRKGSVVAHFIKRILAGKPLTVFGDGSQTRDYVFASDLTQGIVAALESDVTGTYQLGSGCGTPLSDVIALIRDASGRDFEVLFEPFRQGEIVHTWCDVSRARADLGYDASTALADGLQATWDWFVENAEGVRQAE